MPSCSIPAGWHRADDCRRVAMEGCRCICRRPTARCSRDTTRSRRAWEGWETEVWEGEGGRCQRRSRTHAWTDAGRRSRSNPRRSGTRGRCSQSFRNSSRSPIRPCRLDASRPRWHSLQSTGARARPAADRRMLRRLRLQMMRRRQHWPRPSRERPAN